MGRDCINYAKRCHKCQIYGDKIHVPPLPLHVMTSPWLFPMWGMDVIGSISLKASNGQRCIFVEAASSTNVTRLADSRFLKKEITCRYGMPEMIISENTLNLNNSMIAEVYSQFKIKHHNSSPYRQKMNGVVEAANKNIKKIYWHETLPFAFYAYRTFVRTSTGVTPFSLVYGIVAVLPIEVNILSLRLNLVEEKRLKVICHGQMYQKRMIRAYNKKIRSREFHKRDLVLKNIIPIQKNFRGK
ncbi:RNA-directed DNA polymerase [Gossypium australe]|uniref:RNA-directed DNA polymerase n=1 Tax=Gossypium australe TaxID=47621 RepID=A0A5B6VIU9_9ROSI|nr:RNA-directed DNA polymerase [Gossypium australe]